MYNISDTEATDPVLQHIIQVYEKNREVLYMLRKKYFLSRLREALSGEATAFFFFASLFGRELLLSLNPYQTAHKQELIICHKWIKNSFILQRQVRLNSFKVAA